ncbi:MAG: methyltransferase domain-containing protein [Caldilineaceae bacterium]
MSASQQHREEVDRGERFKFGENWWKFLKTLSEDRIAAAVDNLGTMLHVATLSGASFLDIGSGSGLSSLSARRLGAKVHSFDYDPESVRCTKELKRRYYPDDPSWMVEQGSVLDTDFLSQLDQFDIVYSWGVLHHTGAMWQAIDNAAAKVKPKGLLHIAIYITQWSSPYWLTIKKFYNRSPKPVQMLLIYIFAFTRILQLLLRGRNPITTIRTYRSDRGMSWFHDIVDWVGGYPYEHASRQELEAHLGSQGFVLLRTRGMEYLFKHTGKGL